MSQQITRNRLPLPAQAESARASISYAKQRDNELETEIVRLAQLHTDAMQRMREAEERSDADRSKQNQTEMGQLQKNSTVQLVTEAVEFLELSSQYV